MSKKSTNPIWIFSTDFNDGTKFLSTTQKENIYDAANLLVRRVKSAMNKGKTIQSNFYRHLSTNPHLMSSFDVTPLASFSSKIEADEYFNESLAQAHASVRLNKMILNETQKGVGIPL